MNSARVEATFRLVNRRLSRPEGEVELAFLNGKALVVTENTRNPDARIGRGNGTLSRGYKLHAMVDEDGTVLNIRVTALNNGEPVVARELLVAVGPWTLVIADTMYDSRRLVQGGRRARQAAADRAHGPQGVEAQLAQDPAGAPLHRQDMAR